MSPIPAMILAAGRGERMRPLTDHTPKPLLQVGGKPLMQWPLEALARGGFNQVVVNTAWLGEQISQTFGHDFILQPASNKSHTLSKQEQTTIGYSHEGLDFGGALETAGGIVRAFPSLGEVFWVLAGDVFAPDFVFSQAAVARFRPVAAIHPAVCACCAGREPAAGSSGLLTASSSSTWSSG